MTDGMLPPPEILTIERAIQTDVLKNVFFF